MLGRARRTAGRTAVSIRSVGALAKIHWREAGPIDRVQIAAAGALALLVFGLFALGATTRSRNAGDQGLASASFSAQPHTTAAKATGKGGKNGLPPLRSGAPGTTGSPASQLGVSTPAADGRTNAPARRRAAKPRRKPGVKAPGAATGLSSQSTPIVVGVTYRAAGVAANLAAGLGAGEAPGDVAQQAGAVASWVNAHGGVGGRHLALRPVSFDPAVSSSYWTAFSPACTALTTGGLRPLAVVGPVEDAVTQAGCMAQRGVPLVGDGLVVGDEKLMAGAGPYLFAPGSMALDRLAITEVRILARDGFLTKGSRVGILRLDGQVFARTAERVRSALGAEQIGVVGEQVLPAARTLADASALVTRAAAAALSLRSARVDRLIVLDQGIATATFMREAERQGFRPRYALNSTMAPAWLASTAAKAQLKGAQGVGFAPLLDVAAAGEPAATDARRRCESIYRDAKVAIGSRTPAGQFAALSLCDDVLAIRSAVEAADDTDTQAWTRALERHGRKHVSAVALGTKLGHDRHDGASTVRRVRFEDACGCMRYAGEPEPAP